MSPTSSSPRATPSPAIVSSNWKKIYPARIENLFKTEPIVNQMLLIGDKLPYVTALFTVNASAAGTSDIESEVGTAVERGNKRLASFEQIRRFRILEREFTIEQGELTPTMKVRRGQVLENHKSLITELYVGKA